MAKPDRGTGDDDVLEPGSILEWVRIKDVLRRETVGGMLLLAATVVALVLANSPGQELYDDLSHLKLGFDAGPIHLRLDVAHWAADGLLAVFFFVAGLELKYEFVAGDLRDPKRALVPVAAACGGVIVPALIFLAVNAGSESAILQGWAIPTATDIAFAVAVLAVIGSRLPSSMRTFLLTLAVVDDLIAIAIIAFVYTEQLQPWFALLSLVPIVLFGVLARALRERFLHAPWLAWVVLFPVGFVAWALVLNSGIHATISAVVLAFTVPVRDRRGDASRGLTHALEFMTRPLSAGVCVPVFAFFSAGVTVGGISGLTDSLSTTLSLGIIVALVVGKTVGITAATWLVTRLQGAELDEVLDWIDVIGLACLAGIGFTVSLLITELNFAGQAELLDTAKVSVLIGSTVAAVLASLILVPRNRHYALKADKARPR